MAAKKKPMPEKELEHGLEEGLYDNLHDGACFIVCLCGWESSRCDTWEEAGADFDKHLDAQA